MAAYTVAEVEILDQQAFTRYVELAGASVRYYGGRHLVTGSAPTAAEGEWPVARRLTIIEFPDRERLQVWYDSPEYAAARDVARTALRRRLLFAEGVPAAG